MEMKIKESEDLTEQIKNMNIEALSAFEEIRQILANVKNTLE